MKTELRERRIIIISFIASAILALTEYIFAIYSHSQSVLMDAAYDGAELIFIGLILFLTPLFYKPISEKRPFGYYQAESIFLIVKGFMMISVTISLAVNVVSMVLSGGNAVNSGQIMFFQITLGVISIIITKVLQYLNKSVTSPIITAEILGWKQDTMYSGGMALAFLVAQLIEKTAYAYLVPYFDPIISLVVVLITLPAILKIVMTAIQDIFLFAPEETIIEDIKKTCNGIIEKHQFETVFYDITRTGRQIWISIYIKSNEELIYVSNLKVASEEIEKELKSKFTFFECELIVTY